MLPTPEADPPLLSFYELRQRAQFFRDYRDSLVKFPVPLPREYECYPFGWVVVRLYWDRLIEAEQAKPKIPRWEDKPLDPYLPDP